MYVTGQVNICHRFYQGQTHISVNIKCQTKTISANITFQPDKTTPVKIKKKR